DPKSYENTDPDLKVRVNSLPSDDDHLWMGRLPTAGTYRAVVDSPARRPYVLRLTLMNPDDPRLDPGIAPEKVSLDLSAIGVREKLARQPFSPTPADLPGDECWPASLAVVSRGKIELRIMSVEAIRKAYWREKGDQWHARLALLERSLAATGRLPSPFDLPVNAINESELDFAAVEKRIDGKSSTALRWLAAFSTPASTPRNPLYYIAEGISRDGRYFLLMRAEVSTPLVEG